jgi:hypothetical protein
MTTFVRLVYLVYLVHLVSSVQPNKQDKPKKPNERSDQGLCYGLDQVRQRCFYFLAGIQVDRLKGFRLKNSELRTPTFSLNPFSLCPSLPPSAFSLNT